MEYDISELYDEATEDEADYLRAKVYADKGGDLVESDPVLRDKVGNRDARFNFTGRIVQAYVARLILGEISGISPDLLKSVRWAVQWKTHVTDLCKYGDAYLLDWESDNGILVRALDPLSTKLIYDAEDDLPFVGIRHWAERYDNKKAIRVNLYDATELQRWISYDQKTWLPFTEDGTDAVIPHSFGQIPLFHSRTALPYGKPVHLEAYGSQDMIMRTVIAHGAAIDFMGWPQLFALYEWGTAGGTSELGDTRLADEGFDDRSEVSKIRRDPGSIWALRAKELGQLQAASSSDFISTLQEYIGTASALSGTPARFFASPGGQHPSADSQRTADADFQESIRMLQDELTDTFQNALGCAAGVAPDNVTVPWRAPEIIGDSEFWNTALRKQEAGVPLPQTLIEAGYSPEQVDAFVAESSGDDLVMERRVGILNTLADAIGKLGAATSTGVIDQKRINAIIDGVIGGA